MKFVKTIGLAVTASVLSLSVAPLASAKTPTVPIEVWALRDVVQTVQVSPDGQHILVLKVESKDGENILEIYKTNDLSKPFRRLNADPMEFVSAEWVSNDNIAGVAWKVVRKKVTRPEEDIRSYKLYGYNLNSNKFSESSGNFSIVNNLPSEPDKVLVQTGSASGTGLGVDPFAAFRPRSYYKFDLKTGARNLVIKGSAKFPSVKRFDNKGNPRYTDGIDPATNELVTYYRKPGDSSWTEFGQRYDMDKHENLYRVLNGFYGLAGFDPNDPNKGYIIDNRGEDKAALWEFDFNTGQFGKKIYGNPNADIMGIQTHSMAWAGNNKMVAAVYPGAKRERHWFDMEEKALHDSFAAKIPHSHQVSISSRSEDGNTMIVTNRGPKDPGSYWLVNNGKMSKLGSRNPLLKPSDLSDVEFIKYPARDGKMIPAYVTKPKGPGPHPLIVMPHGGPHVNEVVGYDEWGQFFANNGYMVLQPQYRMSVGWGQDLFDSAYGQHGLAMQDDKDDGAMYLVKKGMVDPNRMAMYGWSYGGYAALVAASRENNIYQCTIAGAAVADPKKVYLARRNPNSPKALDDWAQRRGMIGINPIDEIDKINIPLMMIHPEADRRVLYFNYKDYKKAVEDSIETNSTSSCTGGLRDRECTTTLYRTKVKGDGIVAKELSSAGGQTYTAKNRFVTLKGADHFYNTLMYEHQEKLYTSLLDYLQNDCGPDGL